MKGSLHTDELMSAVVRRSSGLRTDRRISHAFVFDLPRYPKLLALADCVVNIAPDVRTKRDIVGNAVRLLQDLGIAHPKVAIVAAVETVNPAIPATMDAQALVALARDGEWPGAIVEGPFGFDNAISAEAARIKRIESTVSGDADLLLMPDLNAGNMLYKSFNYIGGGDCAGLVLGARVPIVLTSRADSMQSRMASDRARGPRLRVDRPVHRPLTDAMFKFLSSEPIHDPLASPAPRRGDRGQDHHLLHVRLPLRHPRAPARRRDALHRRQPGPPAEPGRDLRQGRVGDHEAGLAGAAHAAAAAQARQRARRRRVRADLVGARVRDPRRAPRARSAPPTRRSSRSSPAATRCRR